MTINIAPVGTPAVAVAVLAAAALSVSAAPNASLSVAYEQRQPTTSVSPVKQPSVVVTPGQQARLTVGEVCSVGTGRVVVLAASDGPLRTKSGGYILLNPATNPPE
jgi:hypothetical protein